MLITDTRNEKQGLTSTHPEKLSLFNTLIDYQACEQILTQSPRLFVWINLVWILNLIKKAHHNITIW